MIAPADRHLNEDALQQLLDETMPRQDIAASHDHLSRCDDCRRALEQFVGDAPWWDETVQTLASRNAVDTRPETVPSESPPMVDWLTPIITPSDSGLGTLDRYPIAGVIGQGGMGVVLRGWDGELNRSIAIKVLSPMLAGVGAARNRFMREAQAAAAIVHPSVVPIYCVVTSSQYPYLVMPLIEGGNLQQRIDREGPLDLIDVLRIGAEVAEGLSAAHGRGVIHRDIKPANLLIEPGNGRVLLSDFGLARALDDASLTCSGMIAGTPQYMSPEQARGEPLDARSDLFSLGSLLYALATGRPPYRADNALAVLKKISESAPRPAHQVNERLPRWFDALLGRLMTIDVNDRVRTAEDAAELLRKAHAHVSNPSVNELPTPLRRRRRMKAAAITAGVLLLGSVGLAAWWTGDTSRSPRRIGQPTIRQTQSPQNQPPVAFGSPSPFGTPLQPIADETAWQSPSLDSMLQSIDIELSQFERMHGIRQPTTTSSPSLRPTVQP